MDPPHRHIHDAKKEQQLALKRLGDFHRKLAIKRAMEVRREEYLAP